MILMILLVVAVYLAIHIGIVLIMARVFWRTLSKEEADGLVPSLGQDPSRPGRRWPT